MNNDHNLGTTALASDNEVESANAEFKREWPALCKMLGISPVLLGRLEVQVVVALMLIRLHKFYTVKIREIDVRLQHVELGNDGPLFLPQQDKPQ